MNLQDFIEKFAALFETINVSKLRGNSKFKTLDEWSSLAAVSIIAMIDDEYGIVIKGSDIRNSKTLNDLYELVKSKSGE
jgi:acyl carrier protein